MLEKQPARHTGLGMRGVYALALTACGWPRLTAHIAESATS